jgi:hypothetical protein
MSGARMIAVAVGKGASGVLRVDIYPRQVVPQEQFVYHQLASDFRGTVLYPLNHLATVYPDIYAREAPKYAGREGVMSYRVPHLDAPWADTVNLSTLDPRLLVAARERLGIASSQLLQRRLLRIPIGHLARHRLVRYSGATRWIDSSPGEDVPTEPPAHEFEPTDPQTYRETIDVPVTHLEYLTECQAVGKRPLGFVHVPHVLVLGPIDISDLRPMGVG